MIKSMTAFARTQQSLDSGDLIWEIRSVNSRFLELHFKMPEDFRVNESRYRELLQHGIKRGKVECLLLLNPGEQGSKEVCMNHLQEK